MRFTSEEAFESAERGEPIIVTAGWAWLQCRTHQSNYLEMEQELGVHEIYAAHEVLEWLGY